ncbi:MAG: glycosyltransferase family 4 protein [Steroidobacteraceae bacterium]
MRFARPQLLLVTGSLECGGSERQIADMANYWVAHGLDVTVATWSSPRTADFYGLDRGVRRVHLDVPVTGRIRGNLQRVRKLRQFIDELQPDAVLSFLTRSNVPTILAGLGRSFRIVVSERVQPAWETDLPLGWHLLRRLVYGRATAIVSQTRATAEWIRVNWGHKALVIPNALRTLPSVMDRRETLIVSIGRLVPQKGFDLLLPAFAAIAGRFPDWRIAILGEGPERDNLLRLRDKLGLVGRVEFFGRVKAIEDWMARAGIVVQPSRFEGFPNAVLESMGMGAAVVSADCPAGPADLIEDGVNGRLVPVEDVATLSRIMAELMAEPALREGLGREALKVRERFRQETIMAQWEALLFPQ